MWFRVNLNKFILKYVIISFLKVKEKKNGLKLKIERKDVV